MTTAVRLRPNLRHLAAVLAASAVIAGCATYGERVAPVPMPTAGADAVTVEGARLVARAYLDPDAAAQAFGFDIRGAGLLPLQVVVDNQSGRDFSIRPGQTLLVDRQGNAWPLLSAQRAAERVRHSVQAGEAIRSGARTSLLTGLAGTVVGAAVGIVSGESVGEAAGRGAAAGAAIGAVAGGASEYANVGRDIQRDLRQQGMDDQLVKPGELAYGFLFFPGRDEAQSVQSLRLGIQLGEETHVVLLPVTPAQPLSKR